VLCYSDQDEVVGVHLVPQVVVRTITLNPFYYVFKINVEECRAQRRTLVHSIAEEEFVVAYLEVEACM
jgi:hypothetical protein